MQTTKNRPTSNLTLSHEQHLELFEQLETAKSRLAELKQGLQEDTAEIKNWEKRADDARNQLILTNQGLVGSVALRYGNRGLDYEDLVSMGNLGLMQAIDKFDYRQGFKLSTYATTLIKGSITRALSKYSRTIRIPEDKLAEIRDLQKTREQFIKMHGCDPTVEEIAGKMDLPVSKVTDLLALSQQTISLNAMIGEAKGSELMDFIGDSSAANPADEAYRAGQKEMLGKAFKTLTDREREMLGSFYGLGGQNKYNLEKIGENYGLSGERIRQICIQAQGKILKFFIAEEGKINTPVVKTSKVMLTGASSASKSKSVSAVSSLNKSRLKRRAVEKNENHHLWLNNGVWYSDFMLKSDTGKNKRVRNSLYTNDVEIARRRRDVLIGLYSHFAGQQDS